MARATLQVFVPVMPTFKQFANGSERHGERSLPMACTGMPALAFLGRGDFYLLHFRLHPHRRIHCDGASGQTDAKVCGAVVPGALPSTLPRKFLVCVDVAACRTPRHQRSERTAPTARVNFARVRSARARVRACARASARARARAWTSCAAGPQSSKRHGGGQHLTTLTICRGVPRVAVPLVGHVLAWCIAHTWHRLLTIACWAGRALGSTKHGRDHAGTRA